MKKTFLFADIVKQFELPFTSYVPGGDGYYDDYGDWIESSETEETVFGLWQPLSEDDVNYAEGGVYTSKDKKIYMRTPLVEGQKVLFDGDTYTIQNFRDHTKYSDVFVYYARWREK